MTNSSTEKDHVNEVVIKLIGANVIVYNVREHVLTILQKNIMISKLQI